MKLLVRALLAICVACTIVLVACFVLGVRAVAAWQIDETDEAGA